MQELALAKTDLETANKRHEEALAIIVARIAQAEETRKTVPQLNQAAAAAPNPQAQQTAPSPFADYTAAPELDQAAADKLLENQDKAVADAIRKRLEAVL